MTARAVCSPSGHAVRRCTHHCPTLGMHDRTRTTTPGEIQDRSDKISVVVRPEDRSNAGWL